MEPKLIKAIGIIVLILIGISIYKNGLTGWKADMLGKTVDTGKDVGTKIIETGKDLIDKNKTTTTTTPTTTQDTTIIDGRTYYGKPMIPTDCITDSDCIFVDDCSDCKCDINSGQCYR